jgi:hypothetical protein
MRRSLLNCVSPLEADVIGTLISCQAVNDAEHHGSDADRQAVTGQFVAGREILP